MAEEEIDIGRFANEISQYPEIFDQYCEEYSDKVKKQEAWLKVCEALYEDFHQESEDEKNAIENKLKNKWKNLRDGYARSERNRRLADPGKPVKQYVYAKELWFLKQNESTPVLGLSSDSENDVATEEQEFVEEPLLNSSVSLQKKLERKPISKENSTQTPLCNCYNTSERNRKLSGPSKPKQQRLHTRQLFPEQIETTPATDSSRDSENNVAIEEQEIVEEPFLYSSVSLQKVSVRKPFSKAISTQTPLCDHYNISERNRKRSGPRKPKKQHLDADQLFLQQIGSTLATDFNRDCENNIAIEEQEIVKEPLSNSNLSSHKAAAPKPFSEEISIQIPLRDSYNGSERNKRLSGPSKPKKQCLHARPLSFPQPIGTIPATDSSRVSKSNVATEEQQVVEEPLHNSSATLQKESALKHRRKDLDENPINFTNTTINFANSSVPSLGTNEDRAFFDILVPIVSTFNMAQKLDFRIAVLKIAKEIEQTGTTSYPL